MVMQRFRLQFLPVPALDRKSIFFAAAPRAADGSASSDINKALDAVQASLPARRADLSRLGHYAYAQVGAVRRVSKF